MGEVPPPLQALQQRHSAGCTSPTAVHSTPRTFQIIRVSTYFGALERHFRDTRQWLSKVPVTGECIFIADYGHCGRLLYSENKPASSSPPTHQPYEETSCNTENGPSPASSSVEKRQIHRRMLRPKQNNHERQRPSVRPSLRNAPIVSDGK